MLDELDSISKVIKDCFTETCRQTGYPFFTEKLPRVFKKQLRGAVSNLKECLSIHHMNINSKSVTCRSLEANVINELSQAVKHLQLLYFLAFKFSPHIHSLEDCTQDQPMCSM